MEKKPKAKSVAYVVDLFKTLTFLHITFIIHDYWTRQMGP
jgi:hypothetical protein